MTIIAIYSFNQIVEAMMEYNGSFEESFPTVWSNLRVFHHCLDHMSTMQIPRPNISQSWVNLQNCVSAILMWGLPGPPRKKC